MGKQTFWAGIGLGAVAGWTIAQQLWAINEVSQKDAHRSLATERNRGAPGRTFEHSTETDAFTRSHIIENGIERISYLPKQRKHQTPLLFQHGMWHGAWCWQYWQELFAQWGWESHAHSLPGHAGSPEQRPVARCTLDYYLAFLKREVDRLPQRPVLVGHSMGGALVQWYLKFVGDLPAAVLVAPWASHRMLTPENLWRVVQNDPLGALLSAATWTARFGTHNPAAAAWMLTTRGAIFSPEELHARLNPESMLVLYQHNPPYWTPPERVNTPLLWLGGEKDQAVPEPQVRQSAAFYGADYRMVSGAGHNLMLEHNYRSTADTINRWLAAQKIP
ncbi:MAG: alpha/beta fold hydrolase [Chloroflexi bacterium]|nr:MAG: alpha/beta fold hydrolase [Chloroflexota bacterium]